jgi:hypothetical protein
LTVDEDVDRSLRKALLDGYEIARAREAPERICSQFLPARIKSNQLTIVPKDCELNIFQSYIENLREPLREFTPPKPVSGRRSSSARAPDGSRVDFQCKIEIYLITIFGNNLWLIRRATRVVRHEQREPAAGAPAGSHALHDFLSGSGLPQGARAPDRLPDARCEHTARWRVKALSEPAVDRSEELASAIPNGILIANRPDLKEAKGLLDELAAQRSFDTDYGRLARSAAPTGAGCRRRSDRAGLVGARVAQGPYDVARRASCAS